MTENKATKICSICGDKSIGKNFGAITCEPCKAFFRRNAIGKTLECYFNSNCKINLITRKFCQKCRLNKCFAVGMRKEFILNEEKKELRKNKSESNKEKVKYKRTKDSSIKSPENEVKICNEIESSMDSVPGGSTEATFFNQIPYNINNDIMFDIFNENSSIDINSNEKLNLEIMEIEDYIKENELNVISDDVYQKVAEFELAVIPIARPVTNDLNETELSVLRELLNATKLIRRQSDKTNFTGTTHVITNVVELGRAMALIFDRGVRSLVKVTKSLSAFENICENDRIALLKYGSIQVLSMRSVLYYNNESEYWTLYLENDKWILLTLDFLKNLNNNAYSAYKYSLQKIGREWDSDRVIIDLLTAIILFNPNRPNLIHREAIKSQQHIYMYLLKRYLLLRYRSECESKEKFLKLINSVLEINNFRKIPKNFYSKIDHEDIGPLLVEILDINPNNSIDL